MSITRISWVWILPHKENSPMGGLRELMHGTSVMVWTTVLFRALMTEMVSLPQFATYTVLLSGLTTTPPGLSTHRYGAADNGLGYPIDDRNRV